MHSFLKAALAALFVGSAALSAVPLADTDIGHPTVPGALIPQGSAYDLTAGGKDVWGVADQFHFAYVGHSGDFEAVVHVERLKAAQLYSRIGLMARESLDPASRHLFFVAFSNNQPRHNNNAGYEFQFRERAGGKSQAIYPPKEGDPTAFLVAYPDTWLRLRRAGNVFTAYASSDGKTWTQFGVQTVDLPADLLVGVGLTAHDPAGKAEATFRDFAVTP